HDALPISGRTIQCNVADEPLPSLVRDTIEASTVSWHSAAPQIYRTKVKCHAGPSMGLRINSSRHPGDRRRSSYRWKTVSRLWGWTPVFTGVTTKPSGLRRNDREEGDS